MSAFIFFHLLNHESTAGIFCWEPTQMAVEVAFDLLLCFFQKTKAPAVPRQAGCSADNECPSVPERVE